MRRRDEERRDWKIKERKREDEIRSEEEGGWLRRGRDGRTRTEEEEEYSIRYKQKRRIEQKIR